ncbi:hypothetical protein VN24_11465 [Paenibacillus beijingensis]|uniref:ABC transporter substrate-binding protein n=2 Tax=Paenibacillus beijingensis TaxID=1126833 RepID=A0A0D5NQU1_9BACL|nr:hypothetical protein VN24_11465 [Paenibacillus beijingensis]
MKKSSAKAILSATVLLPLAAAGCGQNAPSEANRASSPGASQTAVSSSGVTLSRSNEGETITFLTSGTPWMTPLIEKIPEFEKLTGITVDVQQMVDTQLSNKVSVSASTGGHDLDLIYYRPLQEALLFIKNNWLEDLSGYIQQDPDFHYEDFFQAGRDITSKDGKVYGIPTMSERTMFFYNTEMFKDAGLSGTPKTYEELEEYAKKLHDPDNNRYAFAVRGEGNSAVTQFAAFLRGFGGDFIKDGKAAINTPEAIKAFEFYGKLVREYSAPGAISNIWSDSLALFTQGRAAMYIDGDVHYAETEDPESSVVAGKVGFGPFPAGPAGSTPSSIIPWAIGISSGSKHKEASWEFIRWATSKGVDLELELQGNSSARDSTWKNPKAEAVFPSGMVEVIKASGASGNPIDRPYLISGGEARSIVAQVLTAAIAGKKELQPIADDANARLQTLVDKEKQ